MRLLNLGGKGQFPEGAWLEKSPAEAGFDEDKLQAASDWLDNNARSPYRVGILRDGHLVAVWHKGVELNAKRGIGSGHKEVGGILIYLINSINIAETCLVV